MKLLGLVAVLAVAPMLSAQARLDVDINSSTPGLTGLTFGMDDILNQEVGKKYFAGWGWPVFELTFAPVDVTGDGIDLLLHSRYHRDDGNYADAQIWLLIYDSDGTELNLEWSGHPNNGQGHWTGDYWRYELRDLDLWLQTASPAFDGTQVSKLLVRSTNWGGNAAVDYLAFSNLTITPEPASLAALALALVVLRRR